MPPPSSGGVHLVQILNILEGFDLAKLEAGSADAVHLLAEAMKPAYADRAAWLGDPERFRVPVRGLTAKRYADGQRAAIDGKRARPAEAIQAGDPLPHEADQTTHFSVVDRDGNAVANTYTLNFSYGLGLVAAGTGVLLNNEMDDFSAKAGAQNAYGLVGGDTNLAAPGARPLSSMTPTFVFRDGRLAARHRQSRRQPHHLDGAAGHRQHARFPHEPRRGGGGAARPPPMAAGRPPGRNRIVSRYVASVARARP